MVGSISSSSSFGAQIARPVNLQNHRTQGIKGATEQNILQQNQTAGSSGVRDLQEGPLATPIKSPKGAVELQEGPLAKPKPKGGFAELQEGPLAKPNDGRQLSALETPSARALKAQLQNNSPADMKTSKGNKDKEDVQREKMDPVEPMQMLLSTIDKSTHNVASNLIDNIRA